MAVTEDPTFYPVGTNGKTPAADVSASQKSALAIVTDFLRMYGLESLGAWAWNKILAGETPSQIELDLPQTPEYNQRFPAAKKLAEEGRAITPGEYIAYEQSTRELLQRYQVPSGMYDSADMIADLLIKSVSPAEVSDRLRIAATAAYKAPKEVQDALRENYGVTMGDMTGYYLDPDRATPLLEQQYAAAQISGAATQQNVQASVKEAERLAAQGVTYEQAREGYGNVAATGALGSGLGEAETAGQGTRVAGVFGDQAAAKKVERVVKSRQAQFGDQGGAAADSTGVSGLGTKK
jgi:hypothetical protein